MRALPTPPSILGESPAWNPETRTLSWVDIDDGRVFSAPFQEGELGSVTALEVGGSVGVAAPVSGGRFLVSLEAWLGILHTDGRLEKSRPLLPVNRRFNDGKIDPQGRLVVGSLRRFGPADGQEVLIRLEPDGGITTLDATLNLSNGLGWSPDGAWLYHVDSVDRVVYRRAYGTEVGERETFVHLDGLPDGMTVDAQGDLWITVLDRCRIECWSAAGTPRPERTIELDALHPASVEFVGEDLATIVVTTGFPRVEGDVGVSRAEGDGAVLVTRIPGVRGQPATPWRDAPLPR